MTNPLNTSGGANVDGNVNTQGGDFVNRDKHFHGDEVHGDKVIIQHLDPTDIRNQRNHKVMRQLVRKFWIDGVLKFSIYNEALINLDLTEQPKAVDNRPWDLIQQQPGQPDNKIPAGTPIIDVFDKMNQLLLILGEPGSGKTTMLLELADALLKRAGADPTHPTPVVFNLSSWSEKRQPLAEWLVEELRIKYNIPQKVAQQWINNEELLPLLDGFDEVKQEHRYFCVEAINKFRQQHLVPMAICSRIAEYENLAVYLRLQGAVLIQPLTLEQINKYLNEISNDLRVIRIMLQEDMEFQKMATTPLLLSVMVIAYRDMSMPELSLIRLSRSRYQHLFDAYIKRMFIHRDTYHIYPVRQTIYWLSWLAENMCKRQQIIFLIEMLQPYWLRIETVKQWYKLIFGFITGLAFALILGAAISLAFGLFIGISGGLVFGILIGWWVVYTFGLQTIIPVEHLAIKPSLSTNRLLSALFNGALLGFFCTMFVSIYFGIQIFITTSIILGLVWGVLGRYEATSKNMPNQGIRQSFKNMLIVALGGILCVFLISILSSSLADRLSVGMMVFVNAMLAYSLGDYGGSVFVRHLALRLTLWQFNYAPLNYVRFLDYCYNRLFLRKVGGGYIFIHRMLMEHFASLTDEDIERIAASVEARK